MKGSQLNAQCENIVVSVDRRSVSCFYSERLVFIYLFIFLPLLNAHSLIQDFGNLACFVIGKI